MRQTLDKISTQILRVVPFILSLITPLFFLPITTDYFTFNKYFFIAVIGTISLIAWCVRNLTRGKLHLTSSPALVPLIVLVLANIVSSIWLSPTQHISLFGQASLFFFLAIIFITVTSSQKNRFTVNSAIYGLIISASIISLYSLLQRFGIIVNENRFFNLTGSVLSAIAFTLPILIATTLYSVGTKNWIFKSALFVSILLMIVGTVINISLLLPQNGQLSLYILPVRAGWSIAIDTMKTWKTALLGTGPETFFTAFTRLRPVYLNLDKNLWGVRFSESSNYLFTLITTTGIIGALAFLLSFLRPLLVSLKVKNNIEDKNTFNFLLTALSFVILSFLVIPTGIVSLTLGVVLLICLTTQLKVENKKSIKDITFSLSANSSDYQDLPETVKNISVSTAFLPWLAIFLSVALLTSYWFFAGRTYLASVNFKQATNLMQTDTYGAYMKFLKASELDTFNSYYPRNLSQLFLSVSTSNLAKKDPTDEEKKIGTDYAQRAINTAKISAQLDPANVTVWENLFSIYNSLIPYAQGSADLAISHGLQATSVYPSNPTLYLQLGILFYNLGDTDQAIRFINRANELKQDWDLPYLNLSGIYKAKKEYSKALQYANTGVQYTDPKSANLTTIQEEIKALEKLIPVPATATPSAAILPTTPQQ